MDVSAIVPCKPLWLRSGYKSYPAIPVAGEVMRADVGNSEIGRNFFHNLLS